MSVMPFVCIGLGLLTGAAVKGEAVLKGFDVASQLALMALMFTIGLGTGMDPVIIRSLPVIGLRCGLIALCAIFFSVLLVYGAEKTLLADFTPEDGRAPETAGGDICEAAGTCVDETAGVNSGDPAATSGRTWSFMKTVPVCLGAGILTGFFTYRMAVQLPKNQLLFASLVVLYTGVGVGMGGSKNMWRNLRKLGLKVLFFPCCILLGSLLAGVVSGVVLRLPFAVTVLASGGMSYYSMTGAFMTGAYGAEAGTYGFLVNVFRELFTVLLLPFLARLSKGSAVAAGAAGNMDTMLLPVINCCGQKTGVIALITGTVLTFIVPFLLPLLEVMLPFPG